MYKRDKSQDEEKHVEIVSVTGRSGEVILVLYVNVYTCRKKFDRKTCGSHGLSTPGWEETRGVSRGRTKRDQRVGERWWYI